MRSSIAAVALALAGPAFGLETTLMNDQFTVTTNSGFEYALVGGAVQLQGTPYLLAFATPAQSPVGGDIDFHFAFAPKAGHALHGETVTFSIDLDVDELDPRTTLLTAPLAEFTATLDAQHSVTRSSDSGLTHFSASWFVTDPNVDLNLNVFAREGLSCLIGDEANDCNFGGSVFERQALVELMSLSVTPQISTVPEPGSAGSWATALGTFALAGLLTRRSARRLRRL